MGYFDFLFKKGKKQKRNSSYDGAAKGRRTSSWWASGRDADSTILASLITLRNRSRDLVRNDAYAKRGIDVIVNNAIGKGIRGTIKVAGDGPGVKKRQQKLNDLWEAFSESKAIDFDGVNDFFGLQKLVLRSTLESGDCLVRARVVKADFPLQIQVLEGDHLQMSQIQQLDNGNNIVHGIEFNDQGKIVAYHITVDHPGSFLYVNNRNTIRISADELTHVYKKTRPGQTRGIPELAPVMLRLKTLNDYEDAQLERQRIAACFAIFIKDIVDCDIEEDTEAADLISKVEPGLIEVLPNGKDVTAFNPPQVDGYKEFMGVNLHSIAAALGISFEALTGDLSEVNFSSARMGWLEMNRTIDDWRWNVLKSSLLDFVSEQFLKFAFLKGENVDGAKFIWTPPKREMIDPTKEIPATINSIRGGLQSLPDAIRAMGNNPDDYFREIEETNKKIDELGLVLDSDPRKVNKSGTGQVDNSGDEDEGKKGNEENQETD